MDILRDHMLIDPSLKADIAARAQAGNFGDDPDSNAHYLGEVTLPDGTARAAWVCHAADAVLLDEAGQILLITRLHNPGRGKLALPGGLLDVVDGKVEPSRIAALREATEETGISPAILATAKMTQIGHRLFNRPFDIRSAWNNLPGTKIRQGEFFTVSTLGFAVRLQGNLRDIHFQAGDDATAVQIVSLAALEPERFAVPDHITLIRAATAL